METIYRKALEAIEGGHPFSISFKDKKLKVGRKLLINNGNWDGSLTDDDYPKFGIPELEKLYDIFRHSIPSEMSERPCKKYFIPLGLDELDEEDMMYGCRRERARFELEFYLLSGILKGQFSWERLAGEKWFWKSETHASMIMLRDWFE